MKAGTIFHPPYPQCLKDRQANKNRSKAIHQFLEIKKKAKFGKIQPK
jgi:hypothetical protein